MKEQHVRDKDAKRVLLEMKKIMLGFGRKTNKLLTEITKVDLSLICTFRDSLTTVPCIYVSD